MRHRLPRSGVERRNKTYLAEGMSDKCVNPTTANFPGFNMPTHCDTIKRIGYARLVCPSTSQPSPSRGKQQSIVQPTICTVAAPQAICVRRRRLPLLGKRYWNM